MWTAALPFILAAAPHIVQLCEVLFARKKKSGDSKKGAAIGLLQAGLQVAGHIPVPSKDQAVVSSLGSIVDLVVADLNQAGVLAPLSAATAAASAALPVKPPAAPGA